MFTLPLLLIHQLYLLQAPLLPLALAPSSFLVSCATRNTGRPAIRSHFSDGKKKPRTRIALRLISPDDPPTVWPERHARTGQLDQQQAA
ncbi:MAG: hypothetical protein VYA27_03480, partial [Verrucomicrobiota bacterium]|nr:hypothetical protein [Verrucomicrobiota bacterium]